MRARPIFLATMSTAAVLIVASHVSQTLLQPNHTDVADEPAARTPSQAAIASTVSAAATQVSVPAGSRSDPWRAAGPTFFDLELALASTVQQERENALTKLLPVLVARDAHAAARFAELYTSRQMREPLLRGVAHLWAAQDAAGALAWAETLSDINERDATISDVCAQVALNDAARAVQMRERYAPSTEPDAALENFMQQWATQDLQAALQWTAARPQGKQRDLLLERIAFVQSQTEPSNAARLIVEHVPEGQVQTEAIMTVLHQWANRNPAAAAEWVDRFPQGALRQRANAELMAIAQMVR